MKVDRTAADCAPDEPAPDVRSRILGAAFAVLRERGYAATSTNEIAARARVSKRELYSEFGSKQGILEALIAARAARIRQPLESIDLRDRPMLAATLTRFGAVFLRELFDPAVVSVFRLAMASADESPEMARVLDRTAREPTRLALVQVMERARAARLVVGEPPALAARFSALLVGSLHVSILLGLSQSPAAGEIERHVGDVVEAFLRLHGAPRASSRPAGRVGAGRVARPRKRA